MMRATLDDRANWTYHAIRPLPVPVSWRPGQHVTADCSHGVKLLCRWAGAPDPMDGNFSPYGNSSTLCLKLPHLARRSDLKVGDVVTFGAYGSQHAAMVLEPGSDPLVWSFGHQGAPNTYRLSQDHREQQYLRLRVPDYVPTPEDKLRARTGWWAWVAWRLGEGDWKKHGKANGRVRPAVPKVIPARWWVELARFLAARKRADEASGL